MFNELISSSIGLGYSDSDAKLMLEMIMKLMILVLD